MLATLLAKLLANRGAVSKKPWKMVDPGAILERATSRLGTQKTLIEN